jgi:hypothetical protein
MEPFDVYRTFLAVSLHFRGDYDYFKYNGQIKSTPENFSIDKKKYSYVKLSRTAVENELPYLLALAHMENNERLWIQNFTKNDKYSKRFDIWKTWQENRMANLAIDLTFIQKKYIINTLEEFAKFLKVEDEQLPKIFVDCEEKSIELSTLMILDFYLDLYSKWDTKLKGNFLWDSFYQRARKFKPFFSSWRPMGDVNIMRAMNECLLKK